MKNAIKIIILALAVLRPGVAGAATDNRPNILFIMSDDHAAQAIGAYGARQAQTPYLDRLAKEGELFTRVFVTNSICTPSRAAILTGQYSHINGVPVFNHMDRSRLTVAKLMQKGGYYTGMIGKWHLGSDPQGFDRWEILPGQGSYFDPEFYTADGETRYPGRYVTGVITERALDFIEHRPQDKPFFLMMHHKATHRNWQPEPKYAKAFADKEFEIPENFFDDYAGRDALRVNHQRIADDMTNSDLKLPPPPGLDAAATKTWLREKPTSVQVVRDGANVTLTGKALARWKYQRYMQDYLATAQSLDDSIGDVMAYLKRKGLERNTIVIYTSDQGFFTGEHGLFDKRFMYEESLRMPFIVRWPAQIKAGTRTDAIGLNVDFAPTFLDAAGIDVPAEMQGRSLLPVLKGRTPKDWRTAMYYRYYQDPGEHATSAHYGIRTATHKLIYFWKKDQWELYDLRRDPREMHNVYGQRGTEKVTAELKQRLVALKRELKDNDEFAEQQPANDVDSPTAQLRGM